jgi:hypothetical protein
LDTDVYAESYQHLDTNFNTYCDTYVYVDVDLDVLFDSDVHIDGYAHTNINLDFDSFVYEHIDRDANCDTNLQLDEHLYPDFDEYGYSHVDPDANFHIDIHVDFDFYVHCDPNLHSDPARVAGVAGGERSWGDCENPWRDGHSDVAGGGGESVGREGGPELPEVDVAGNRQRRDGRGGSEVVFGRGWGWNGECGGCVADVGSVRDG